MFELRIDRPARRNALDVATVERLRRELDAEPDEDATRLFEELRGSAAG